MNRRGFLQSCLALCAAPAIVRVDSLMRMVPTDTVVISGIAGEDLWAHAHPQNIMEELAYITRRAFVPKLVVQIYNQSPVLMMLNKNAEARTAGVFGDLSKWGDALCDNRRAQEIFEQEIRAAQADHRREFGPPDIAADIKQAHEDVLCVTRGIKWVSEDGYFTL